MKITRPIALLSFLALAACSSDDAPPVPETSSTDTAPSVAAPPPKVSDDNIFKSQLDALSAAKLAGKTAQESIDKNQKALEEANQ